MTYQKDHFTLAWKSAPEYDAARILGTYAGCVNGFFPTHGFTILPYPSGQHVYLPNISYEELGDGQLSASYRPKDHQKDHLNLISKLTENIKHENGDLSLIQEAFKGHSVQLKKVMTILFPAIWHHIKEIEVVTTPYGTTSSFDFVRVENNFHVTLWIRATGINSAQMYAELLHALVSVCVLITTSISDVKSHEWYLKEYLIDYLLHQTELKNLIDAESKTVSTLKKLQKSRKVETDSAEFAKKLGLLAPFVVILKDDTQCIVDSITIELTRKEFAVIHILYERRNEFVTKEELLSAIFSEDIETDWSLSKRIERIRKKMSQAGVLRSPIVTSRQYGYKLVTS